MRNLWYNDKKVTERIDFMKKYGIFKSSHEMRNLPKDAWEVIETDEWIREPLETFDSEEEAIEKLHKDYKADITEQHYVRTFYSCEVYFVAEVIDKTYGDGIEITPLNNIIQYNGNVYEAKPIEEYYDTDILKKCQNRYSDNAQILFDEYIQLDADNELIETIEDCINPR